MRVTTTLLDAASAAKQSVSIQGGIDSCGNNNTTSVRKGNKCGHNPAKFRDYESTIPLEKRPPLIQKIIRKLEKLQLTQRSERRESMLLVLKCIADYTDLISGQCWDGFKLISLLDIAKKTKQKLRRVQHAVRELKLLGYLTISERYKKLEDGAFCALVAIKKLTPKLFFAIGISHYEIEAERHKSIKRKMTKKFYVSQSIGRTSKTSRMAKHALAFLQQKLK